jgi:hypothetical protein
MQTQRVAAELDPRYRRTYELLRDRCGERHAQMYFSAAVVLSDPDLPDRLAMAAHELREIIEHLPEASTMPIEDPEGPQAKNIANDLKTLVPEWKAACQVNDWSTPLNWLEIVQSKRARDVLDRLHQLIAAAARLPLAVERLLRAAAGLDPSQVKAPANAYKPTVMDLRQVQKHFIAVAHRHEADDVEFLEQVDRLGILLRALLAEAPVADYDAITRAIAEVEGV